MKLTKNSDNLNPKKKHSIAVILHLFYTQLFDEIRTNLDFLGSNFDLYVSIPEEQESFIETIKEYYPEAHVLEVENRGRDLAPFLEFLKIILPLEYEIMLKIHTKETVHRPDGVSWRKDVFNKLLGSETQINIIKSSFTKNPNLAIIGPTDHVLDSRFYMGSNRDKVQSLLYKAGYPQSLPESFSFVASTMFWARPKIFKPLLEIKIETESFESEPLPVDGCLPHALERFIGLLVEIQGFEIRSIDGNGILSIPDPYKIYPFATAPAHLRLRDLKSVVFYSAYEQEYAIEHLRITAPFTAARVKIIEGVRNGIPDPDLVELGDAVIFQREYPKNVSLYDQIVSNARAAGKFVFYELDDFLFELPEDHPERIQELYNEALFPMFAAMTEADLVLVPTEELRRVAENFNPNVIYLPNYLDDNLWEIRSPRESSDDQVLRIGYMGSNSHTPDLALIAPVLKEIVEKYDCKVQVDIWGTPLPEELAKVDGIYWHPSPTNRYIDFVKFFQTLEFDIAIAPLEDNLFNRCKSELKFLEYSANGFPGVYSRITPYESIVDDGVNGFLAGNSDEWFASITKLIEDANLRKQIVKSAQKEVAENRLLSKNIQSWRDIFNKLTKSVYLEDLGKVSKSHIYNVVNRQLYLDRVNAKTYLRENDNQIEQLNQRLNYYEQTLNEIYQSRSWKIISNWRKNVEKITEVNKKAINFATPILRIIPRRSTQKKQTIIDSGLFDPDYYLSKNPDVKNVGVDPLEHFLNFGGVEGRNPSSEFDSSWYLNNNADVKAAKINPLLHFLLYGEAEGRESRPAIGGKNESSLVLSDSSSIKLVQKSVPNVIVFAPKIKDILEKSLRDNYVLSLSHDDYLTITGGTQVYITDEQRLVNQKGQSYIHIYPYNKVKAFVSSDTILYLGVNLDGKQLFETESNELISALTEIKDKNLTKLSIHHSMGFNSSIIQTLIDLAGGKGVFWLHDYFSLCPSYNLLRNDFEYCGAPNINSNSCRLCSYGNQRKIQAKEFEQLFRENQLEIVAPSQFTYELWQSRFPIISKAHIIPPAVLMWTRNNFAKYKGGQLRVAFLGYPLDYKGWSSWLKLVREFEGSNDYRFFHFSSQQGAQGNYKRIDTRVTEENRLVMVESLRWNKIDVAILWSKVAETFSFTLHEALAAGCFIVTNPDSGNIQDYIRRNPNRGLILKDEKELIDFFYTDGLAKMVIDYQKQGKPQADLIFGSLEEMN